MHELAPLRRRELTGAPVATLSAETPLMEAGVDSLAATELSLRVRVLTGEALSPTVVFELPTARAIAAHVAEQASGEAGALRAQAEKGRAEASRAVQSQRACVSAGCAVRARWEVVGGEGNALLLVCVAQGPCVRVVGSGGCVSEAWRQTGVAELVSRRRRGQMRTIACLVPFLRAGPLRLRATPCGGRRAMRRRA